MPDCGLDMLRQLRPDQAIHLRFNGFLATLI
jgi:hypothetical protein